MTIWRYLLGMAFALLAVLVVEFSAERLTWGAAGDVPPTYTDTDPSTDPDPPADTGSSTDPDPPADTGSSTDPDPPSDPGPPTDPGEYCDTEACCHTDEDGDVICDTGCYIVEDGYLVCESPDEPPDFPSIPGQNSNPARSALTEAAQTNDQPSSETLPGAEVPLSSGVTPTPELSVVEVGQPAVVRPESRMLAALYAGTCDVRDIGIKFLQLNDLIVPAGEVLGSAEAIPVGAGSTVVDQPTRDLILSDLVIVVFDEMEPDRIIACGAIGGVLDANGALSIGLMPVNESGATGVAYLGPANAGTATGISIFVQEPAG